MGLSRQSCCQKLKDQLYRRGTGICEAVCNPFHRQQAPGQASRGLFLQMRRISETLYEGISVPEVPSSFNCSLLVGAVHFPMRALGRDQSRILSKTDNSGDTGVGGFIG
jgi:hypothetical protein